MSYFDSEHWKKFDKAYRETEDTLHRCLICNYPQYFLRHIEMSSYFKETLSDVMPLCNRCSRDIYRYSNKFKIKTNRPDLVFQKLWGWSDEERELKFPDLAEKAKSKSLKPKKVAQKVFNPYDKLSRDKNNFKKFFLNGYSPEDLAKMYNVQVNYVKAYIRNNKEELV